MVTLQNLDVHRRLEALRARGRRLATKLRVWKSTRDMQGRILAKPATIDPVLMKVLAEAGVTSREVACLHRSVVRGDKRAVRRIGRITTGNAAVTYDGMLVGTVNVAYGMHWCGGNLRISRRGVQIPETVIELLPGRPVSALINHPLLPPDAGITDVEENSYDGDFCTNAGYNDDDHDMIRTDAAPVPLGGRGLRALWHPLAMAWSDRASVGVFMKYAVPVAVKTSVIMAGVCAVILAGLTLAHPASAAEVLTTAWSFAMGALKGMFIGWTIMMLPGLVRGGLPFGAEYTTHGAFVDWVEKKREEQGF